MEDSSGTDRHWLDDRLRGVESQETGFTVVNSPLRPVVERGDPWKVDVRHHELKAFLEPLADVGDGKARIAVITDVEEDPVARVQTGVLLARRLAEQGRRVLMVDADVRHVGLSRWLPDRDLDAEGLVDVIQYGASVSALRRPGPVEGVEVLAVGSYRPDEATLFDEDALLRLVQQLRSESDVVLVMTPGWVTAERFHPILVHGDAVVVSIHLDRTLGPRLQDLLDYLAGLNVPVAGLMTYAGPDAAERHVDDVFDPTADDETPSGPIDQPLPTPPQGVAPVTPDAEGDPAPPDDPTNEARPETRPRAIEPNGDDDGGSSRVFRFAAVGALLVILAFVGWWGLSSRDDSTSIPSAPGRPPIDVAATSDADADPPAETTTDNPADTVADETQDPEVASTGPDPVAVDNAVDENDRGDDASGQAATPSETQTEPPAETVADGPPVVDEAPTETESPAPAVEAWERALVLRPDAGFALHVASFANPDAADDEVERLRDAEGWDPIVREATVDGKLWYRVLVGRFVERSDALAARGPVGEIIDTDWIGIVRVP